MALIPTTFTNLPIAASTLHFERLPDGDQRSQSLKFRQVIRVDEIVPQSTASKPTYQTAQASHCQDSRSQK